jgi:predicted ester cyclase
VPEERKPEEIWLVRINPQRRAEVPTTLEAIGDRRNELGGNLSVGQELAFIRRVNEWVAEGSLPSTYRRIAVRTIGLDEERLVRPRSLTTASKLDCRPVFVAELTAAGRTAAERFLDVERTRRLVRGTVESTWTRSPTAGVYLADDFALHAVGTTESRGPAAYEEYVDRFHEALDEFSFRVESTVAEDDRVALVWVVGGRHVRRLLGADPSGEHVSIRGVQIARVASEDDEATVVETWIAVDDSELTRGRDTEAPGDVPVLTTASTPVVADLRSAEEGRGVGIDHAERVWGAAETDAARRVARRVVAADHVFGRDREDLKGREAYLTLVESYRDAFPDLRVCVRDVVAEGDHVVVRAAMTGTHEGPFEGIDPTGRRVEAHWTFVHHLADGRIASTGMVDNHGWLIEQLSATPLSGSHASDPTVS